MSFPLNIEKQLALWLKVVEQNAVYERRQYSVSLLKLSENFQRKPLVDQK